VLRGRKRSFWGFNIGEWSWGEEKGLRKAAWIKKPSSISGNKPKVERETWMKKFRTEKWLKN
jgi:hypothetical protein